MSKTTTIVYPVASTLVAAVEAAVIVVAVRHGFAAALALPWYFGVAAALAAGAAAIVTAGLLDLPVLFFTRRLPRGSVSRRLALNLPVLVFFMAAVMSFADIFGYDSEFMSGDWAVAIVSAAVTLGFYLRISFLPVVVETSDRQ